MSYSIPTPIIRQPFTFYHEGISKQVTSFCCTFQIIYLQMATIKKSKFFNIINNFTPNEQSIIANLHKVRNWNGVLRKMQFLKIFVLQSNKSALFQYIIIIIIKAGYQNDFIVAMLQRPPSPFLPLPFFPKTNNHIHPPFL